MPLRSSEKINVAITTKASAGAKSPKRPSMKKKVLKAATVVSTELITAGSTLLDAHERGLDRR